MNTAVLFSSATDEWQTPPAVFEALDAEFGFTVEHDDARVAAWIEALDLTLAHEAPAVQVVVLNAVLARAFRALLANDPPRDEGAALTGLAALLHVEVQHVLEDVRTGAISPTTYRPM